MLKSIIFGTIIGIGITYITSNIENPINQIAISLLLLGAVLALYRTRKLVFKRG